MAAGKGLKVGDKVPVLKFEDVTGKKGTNAGLDDYIVVYSFADRESSKDIMNVMEEPQLRLAKDHPELKAVFIAFADLAMVPKMLRRVVRPVIDKVNDYAMKSMRKNFGKKGVNLGSLDIKFYMVPDWSGEFIKAFGLKDAKDFKVFVTVKSEVVGIFDPSTPDISNKFCCLFDELAKK